MSELTVGYLRRILEDLNKERTYVREAQSIHLGRYEQLRKEEKEIERGIDEALRQLQEFHETEDE